MAQVIEHGESTRLQYGLSGRAADLGWEPSRVLVIDEDLGHSASGAEVRPGFQRLVSEVGLDHVGIVLGIEMSRLARSGREWHQLLELCALSGTLLGDLDGVYDPAGHNDRLLLGLKGTIGGAELHLIGRGMWPGRIARARRGELAVPLPAGFARRGCGEVVLGWSSTCSSGSARSAPCWGSSRTTASSWGSGCGKDPGAGSWPGAVPAAPG